MANFRYFTTCRGEPIQLSNVWHSGAVSTAAREFSGLCPACGQRHQAQRKIIFRSLPVSERRECDARCMYATGKTMHCECRCGGKNHGHGGFVCEAA